MIAEYMASGLLAAGVMTDLLRRRVPNQLVLLGLITGCYLCICRDGIPMGISLFLKDAFWPTLLLFPFYLLGAIGAGDVKIISALSAMTGGYRIRDLILISFLIGAILALIRLIKERQLFFRSGRVLAHLVHCILSRKISKYEPCKESELYVPFTVCIWIAYFLLNFWR